ncbi:hypothetical protein [Syntrophomonas curvata]
MKKRNIFENSAYFLARKSGQMLNIGKLKLNIVNLENEMYNMKAELGGIIYKSFKEGGDCSAQVGELCDKLAQTDKQLQDMQQEAEESGNRV